MLFLKDLYTIEKFCMSTFTVVLYVYFDIDTFVLLIKYVLNSRLLLTCNRVHSTILLLNSYFTAKNKINQINELYCQNGRNSNFIFVYVPTWTH